MITNQLTQYYAVNADNYDQVYAQEERYDDLDDLQVADLQPAAREPLAPGACRAWIGHNRSL